jgi:hypothetical protein
MAYVYLLWRSAVGRLIFRCWVLCFGCGILFGCDLVVLFFFVYYVFLVVKFFMVVSFCVLVVDDLVFASILHG